MKIVAIFTATMATIVNLTTAQYAQVQNNCTFPAYVQSVPYDGSASGPLTTVASKGLFSEPYRASGSTVKMGTQPVLAAPLFFEYSRSDNPANVYYEINNRYGNPFSTQRVRADASRFGCPAPDCPPNQAACYSGPAGSKVFACGRPTNVTVTLCASY